MPDSDLARLYEVETRALTQAVKRNIDRFPSDFVFQLSDEEQDSLRSQNVISAAGRGGWRYLPYAYSEHCVAMFSSVLKSPRAAQTNILIIRAFVKLREMLSSRKELATRVEKKVRAARAVACAVQSQDMHCYALKPVGRLRIFS